MTDMLASPVTFGTPALAHSQLVTYSWSPAADCPVPALRASTIVGVRGELDFVTGGHLSTHVCGVITGPDDHVIVDLSQLEFCDWSGIHALARIAEYARAADCRISLAAPRPGLLRLLGIAGLERLIPMLTGVNAADLLAASPPLWHRDAVS